MRLRPPKWDGTFVSVLREPDPTLTSVSCSHRGELVYSAIVGAPAHPQNQCLLRSTVGNTEKHIYCILLSQC